MSKAKENTPRFIHGSYHRLLPIMLVMTLFKKLGYAKQLLRFLSTLVNSPKRKAALFAGYRPTKHDVFAAVYSKSGTNWLLQIAQQVSHLGAARFEHIHDVVAWPEAPFAGIAPLNDTSIWEHSPTSKRLIKTSMKTEYVPYGEEATYLAVIRDPKEVFVSTYHFFPGVYGLLRHISVEEWLAMFLSKNFLVGSWAEHAASYWAWRDRPNVLVLLFPELKRDRSGCIRRIAETMGVTLTETQFVRIVEQSGFEHMKNHESQFGPPIFPFVDKDERPVMLRGGKTGASGELLSREQQLEIDRFCRMELQQLGSDFPYEEMFAVSE